MKHWEETAPLKEARKDRSLEVLDDCENSKIPKSKKVPNRLFGFKPSNWSNTNR
jgi:hypothetical protein